MAVADRISLGGTFVTNKALMLSHAYNFSIVNMPAENPRYEAVWERAIDYLAAHAGRWVPSWELADEVYGGHCSRSAVPLLIRRARQHFRIESSTALGYRIGRADVAEATCPKCFARRVRYGREWVCYGCPSASAVDLEVGRAAYDSSTNQGRLWTDADLDFIRDNRNHMANTALAAALNRTESGVRGQATAMGLGRKEYIKG